MSDKPKKIIIKKNVTKKATSEKPIRERIVLERGGPDKRVGYKFEEDVEKTTPENVEAERVRIVKRMTAWAKTFEDVRRERVPSPKWIEPRTFEVISLPTAAISTAVRRGMIEKEKELLDRIGALSKELADTKEKKTEKESLATELQQALVEYQKQEEIKYLLGKLAKDAEDCIRGEPEFLIEFAPGKSHSAYVMSIDIRSSTELMLNAKSPDDFAKFISELCDRLTELVIDNGGVFDKFTGDGVLAFFPDFYSGEDAGLRALLTATQAISFFEEHYKKNRKCFRVVTAGTGLGVGIDCGSVHFVNIGESLSVVGTPVVYACRLSAAPAGAIYLNQPAQEDIDARYKDQTVIQEKKLNIKGSGEIVVYDVQMRGAPGVPKELPWRQLTKK